MRSRISPRAIFAFLTFFAIAAPGVNAAPIPVQSVTKNADGITLQMPPGVMRLQVCGDRTIHVTYSPTGVLPASHSLTVLQTPPPGKFSVSGPGLAVNPNLIYLQTAQMTAMVDRRTGAVSFADAQRRPFLAEVSDGGKTLTPSTAASSVDQKFALSTGEALYGLGQHPGGVMNWVGHTIHLQQRNADIAVPVLVSSKGYGVFWNNPAITDVTVSKSDDLAPVVDWNSEAGTGIDYYVFYGPEIEQVIADYRELTGSAPMFGRWAWGFWQCKQRYHSQQQLLDTVAHYRQIHAPLDGIIQDWLYWYPNPWGSHQFEKTRYPDPVGMMKQLHDENVHLLISVWPKFDVDSPNADALRAEGDLYPEVIPYVYPPGKGQWYDPFKLGARTLYWQQISKQLFADGVDGWWLDASEPELTGKWGEYRNFQTGAGPGTEVFNAFPLLHTTAIYAGQRHETSQKRVFILTRSAYAGQQRNAAVAWSGDIRGSWDIFRQQVPNGINFSLSGLPYWNTDTGGFFGGKPTDPKYAELFTRWFQFSAFCPMFRVHGSATDDAVEPSQKDNPGKEIWQFPLDTQKILIDFDNLRYHLLPYIYSESWQVTHSNSTMMRGLVMDFRNDSQVYNIPDQYLFGPVLMACPVTVEGATTRRVYLPTGTSWTDFWTGATLPGGQTIDAAAPLAQMPLFVRAGAILPYAPVTQSAMDPEGALELRVYRGASGSFTLYDDEGDNYNYEKGKYATIPLTWDEKAQTLTIGKRQGSYPGMANARTFKVVWVGAGHGAGTEMTSQPNTVVPYTGKAVTVSFHP